MANLIFLKRVFFCESQRNVKLILKILSDLQPLRSSSNKKTLYSTRSCVNWAFFGIHGPLKRSFHSRFNLTHSCQKKPNLHTNSLNKHEAQFPEKTLLQNILIGKKP
jgi:hypothetical protein